MPVTKQAVKKLHHDRKVSKKNSSVRANIRTLIKTMRKTPSKKALNSVYTALDKAVKIHVIHKKKASRLKSRLSKLMKTK